MVCMYDKLPAHYNYQINFGQMWIAGFPIHRNCLEVRWRPQLVQDVQSYIFNDTSYVSSAVIYGVGTELLHA